MTDTKITVAVTCRHTDTPNVRWTWTAQEAAAPDAQAHYATYAHLEIGRFDLTIQLHDMETLGELLLGEAAKRRDDLARARRAEIAAKREET